VLLPAQAARWESERVRAVLLHELAHVHRGDWLTLMIASGACALFWFHPLVWLAARALRFEAERAADDQAIAAGLRPSTYGAQLLAVLHFASHLNAETERNIMSAAIPMAKNLGTVERRIRAVLDRSHRRGRVTRRNILVVASAGTALVLPLAALTLRAVETSLNKDASAESTGPDRSSPEAVLHSFVEAFNRADSRGARASIFGANPAVRSDELERQLKKARVALTLRDLHATVDGRGAIVTIGEGSLISSQSEQREAHEEVQTLNGEVLKLRRDGGVWRIVPGDIDAIRRGHPQPTLSGIVGMLAAPEATLVNARTKAQIEVCSANLRQLALAAHMYANDHGGRLNFGETAPLTSLKAYAATHSVMVCPLEKPGRQYMFNPQLKNAEITRVAEPAKTVLIYEATENGAQLDFSHNDRTSVVFVDGHAELCTRDEAMKLRWHP
jgi:prepilin-type processing-associated H-X9-DG protein